MAHQHRTIAHRELRNNSSAILRAVEAGEVFTITNHGRPVAVITPVGEEKLPPLASTPPRRDVDFTKIERVTLGRPSQEVLDEQREDRF